MNLILFTAKSFTVLFFFSNPAAAQFAFFLLLTPFQTAKRWFLLLHNLHCANNSHLWDYDVTVESNISWTPYKLKSNCFIYQLVYATASKINILGLLCHSPDLHLRGNLWSVIKLRVVVFKAAGIWTCICFCLKGGGDICICQQA